jgi:methionine aminotransferase
MMQYPGALTTKLPTVGTTIFTTMSRMAAEYNAVNLSQGFPDFPVKFRFTEFGEVSI